MRRIHHSIALPTAAFLVFVLTAAGAAAQAVKDSRTNPRTRDESSRTLPVTRDTETLVPPPSPEETIDREPGATHARVAHPSKSNATEADHGYLSGLDRGRVYFDEPGDGAIWAVGDQYKASFDASGATYIPFFGSRAPKNFPVHIAIAEIRLGGHAIPFDRKAEPVRSANRVTFDRGALLEVYDLTPDSVEQSFVFTERLAGGDLVVRLSVESELARGELDDGLELRGENGSVRYGAAVALDARGTRDSAPTSWSNDAIEIRVPSPCLDRAQYPLIIDPLISTFTIDGTATEDHIQPDVAYDWNFARWSVVYERAYSATDHDVYTKTFTFNGTVVASAFIDSSNDYWANPKVANNSLADQFLVVAAVGEPNSGGRIIRGRTRAADTGALGSPFTIADNSFGDDYNPGVGGDPSGTSPTYYCVVWQHTLGTSSSDILARMVAPDDTLVTGMLVLGHGTSNPVGNPAISKTDGPEPHSLQDWNVVWTSNQSIFDNDLYGAQVHWDGTITNLAFPIDTSSNNTSAPAVTSPTRDTSRKWLVAYSRNPPLGDVEIFGKLYQGTTLLDTADLSLTSGAPIGELQLAPSADCDGSSFVVANTESYQGSATDFDVYISTFSVVGTHIATAEGHVNLAFSSAAEDQVAIVTAGSGGGPRERTFAAWHQLTVAGDGDIEGALYGASPFTIFCAPGVDGVMSCPCGNPPTLPKAGCNNSAGTGGAQLTATGNIAPDTVVLHATKMMPNATCVFLQGGALSSGGITFGDGLRCAVGSLVRLYVKTASGGAADAPSLSDFPISQRSAQLGDMIASGTKRWYQTYYRDPAFFACASPSTFNITSGVQIDW